MSRHLPDWIDAYLDYTSKTEPRESFRKWAAISAVASVLQRKVYLPLGMETFFPNFFIILVGPPAARKGTAWRPARKILDWIGIKMAADETSKQKLIMRLEESYASTSDTEGNLYNHSSLTISASELTDFIGYADIDFLVMLNKWYDCEDRFEYDNIKHGLKEISEVWVNLFGCTTPDLLQLSMPQSSVGSGFTSRTIFVYEDNKAKIVIWPEQDENLKDLLTRDLGEIFTMCGRFSYEDGYIAKYGEWRQLGELHPPIREPKLAYYLERRHVHLLKLSMVFSASRDDDMVLRLVDFERARKTLEKAEKKMPLVFRGMGANPLGRTQLQIMRTIGETKEIKLKDLMNTYYDEISRDDLSKILHTLISMGFCSVNYEKGMVSYINKRGGESDG